MSQANATAGKKGLSRASCKRKKNKEKKQPRVQPSCLNSDDLVERQSKATEQLNNTNKIEKSNVTDAKITESIDEAKPTTTKRKNMNKMKIKSDKNEKETKESETNNDDLIATNESKESSSATEIEELLQEPVITLSNDQREIVTSFYEIEQQRSNISITTCTGVQFQDIKVGHGRLAHKYDVVTFRYIGYLGKLHGSIFDKGLLTVRFGLREIIPGLEEGLATMRSKGKRLVIIPPSLGYGEEGNEKIPPNSILAFVVDIVRIGSKKKNLEEKQPTKKRTFRRKRKTKLPKGVVIVK